jgi:hypothetical protein
MSVWAGLIVSRVLQLADTTLPSGLDVDRLLAATVGPRMELAEPLAQALLAQGLVLPRTDEKLGKYLSARPTALPVNLNTRGLVVVLDDGRLGYTAGDGKVVESFGAGLSVVLKPERGRYLSAHIIPGVTVLGGGS